MSTKTNVEASIIVSAGKARPSRKILQGIQASYLVL
jgi:hypothetical protein